MSDRTKEKCPPFSKRHLHPEQAGRALESLTMIFSRTMLIMIILVMGAIALGSMAAFLNQRHKAGTVEIQFNKDGIRIDRN